MAFQPGTAQLPVTADDLDLAVWSVIDALSVVPDEAWAKYAHGSEWSCRQVGDHLIDAMFSYAAQLGPRQPPMDGWVPYAYAEHPGGLLLSLQSDPAKGTAGLLQAFEAAAGMLSGMIRSRGPEIRAFHAMGVADPEGFAAMGCVEAMAHTFDVVTALNIEWEPDAGLLSRVLFRLFRDVPKVAEPWPTFLWATGRGDIPGHGKQERWRWYSMPHTEW